MSQLIFRLPTHSVTRTLQKGDQRAKPGSHPGRRPYRHKCDEINTWDRGLGVYFDDPSGHLLEIITRPYGSGGTTASQPHPLFAQPLDPEDHEDCLSDQQAKSSGGRLASRKRPKQNLDVDEGRAGANKQKGVKEHGDTH